MNKKIIKVIITLLLLGITGTVSIAVTQKILINNETLSFENKRKDIFSDLDGNYEFISGNNENYELKQTITELTKKTTYLLLGDASVTFENSEDYYKRHNDYLNLRYNPKIPKNPNSHLGIDITSQEYQDDLLSGVSVPGMFLMLEELGIKYNSYENIRVSIVNNDIAISTISLPNVTIKKQDVDNPMKYIETKTDLKIFYYFKKLNDEYKLLYLYGETNDDIISYSDKSNEKVGELTINDDYNSKLKDIYDFSKADAIKENTLTKIYNKNKQNIVFLNSVYNMGTVTSANGFFINEGLIATTYNYIEKSLSKAQKIIISDFSGNVYTLDGIVTADEENDIAILKVKNKSQNNVEIEKSAKYNIEEAVITLNSNFGIGLTASKGIIISKDNNDIQMTLVETEETQGSPIFNNQGNVIGMVNSKILNASTAFATDAEILEKYYNKFSSENFNDIKYISFEKAKENYYIKYNEEKNINNVPNDKWNEYLKVENAEENIDLKLVKAIYKDGIISLRYKNDISNYVDTMQFASTYRENLKNKGYTEKIISNSKIIYESNKFRIVVMKEFDYLIIVMVRL